MAARVWDEINGTETGPGSLSRGPGRSSGAEGPDRPGPRPERGSAGTRVDRPHWAVRPKLHLVQGRWLELYGTRAFALALGRSSGTIRRWEALGVLPASALHRAHLDLGWSASALDAGGDRVCSRCCRTRGPAQTASTAACRHWACAPTACSPQGSRWRGHGWQWSSTP